LKVGIPVLKVEGLKSIISEHFGQANFFLIIEIPSDTLHQADFTREGMDILNLKISVIRNLVENSCKAIVELLLQQEIDALIVMIIGPPPFQLLKQQGIRLYHSSSQKVIGDLLRDYLNNKLEELPYAYCPGLE
jgi:predicted Fe-Mo cluster-binding NifX family protein